MTNDIEPLGTFAAPIGIDGKSAKVDATVGIPLTNAGT